MARSATHYWSETPVVILLSDNLKRAWLENQMAEPVAGNGTTRMYSEENNIMKRTYSIEQCENPEMKIYANGTSLLLRKLYKDSPEHLGSLIVNLGRQAARLHVDKFIKDENRRNRGLKNGSCSTVVVWGERGIS